MYSKIPDIYLFTQLKHLSTCWAELVESWVERGLSEVGGATSALQNPNG